MRPGRSPTGSLLMKVLMRYFDEFFVAGFSCAAYIFAFKQADDEASFVIKLLVESINALADMLPEYVKDCIKRVSE